MIRPIPVEDQVLLPPSAGEAQSREYSSAVVPAHPALQRSLQQLAVGRRRLARMDIAERIRILESCRDPLAAVARDWVETSCQAKGIPDNSPARAEEVLGGPVALMRQLQLYLQTLRQIQQSGKPALPGSVAERDGRLAVPVTPARGLWDQAVFRNFKATTWLQADVTLSNLDQHLAPAWQDPADTETALVLGAGNVNSIPAADALTQLCVENRNVLLKMNPVNAYLGPLLEQALEPLIQNDLLRIVYGGRDVGAAACRDGRIAAIHVTGSQRTHEAIRHSTNSRISHLLPQPTATQPKQLSSELGNVTPWIVVPGRYSQADRQQQIQNLAGSLVNNAGFNCVATRVVVMWKQWSERAEWQQQLQKTLSAIPQRQAYYPNALKQYAAFAGITAEQARAAVSHNGNQACGTLQSDGHEIFVAGTQGSDQTPPWTLIRNLDSSQELSLYQREAFAPVCVEVLIDADSPEQFFARAIDFANDRLWGTLAASLSVPADFRKRNAQTLQAAVRQLRYGAVSLNQWAGLLFALMSPPWGGWPHGNQNDIQSGSGWVHNSCMLSGIEQTVLEAPLQVQPRPVWQPAHPNPEAVAWRMFAVMHHPSVINMSRLAVSSVSSLLTHP